MTTAAPQDEPSARTVHREVTGPLWPPVRRTNPNLFTLIAGQAWLHIGFGLSALYGQHTSSTWTYFGGFGFWLVGTAHLIVATMVVVGVHRWWALARFAFLASVTLYLAQVCLFGAAIVDGLTHGVPVTYEAFVYAAGLTFISVAVYRESVGPRQYFGMN